MLIEHLELALRAANVSIFEIPLGKNVHRPELASVDGLDMAPDDRERFIRELEAFVREEIREFVVEYRLPASGDGPIQWRQARGFVVRDEGGVPTLLVGSSHDISQLKESQEETRRLQEGVDVACLKQAADVRAAKERLDTAEEEARRAVQQVRLATDLSGVGVWGYELSEDGDLAKAKSMFDNDGVMLSLGYDLDDISPNLAARLGSAVHPEDQPRMAAALEGCFTGMTPMFDAECRFIAKDGSLHWKLVRGIVTRDATGRPLTFMGTAVEVTHLKRTQEELRRVKDRLELAVLGSNACTWDFELLDGQIAGSEPVFTNAWELCGYDAPEDPRLAAQAFSVVIAPGDLEPFFAQVQAFLDGPGRDWESELRIVRKDGTDRLHLMRGVVARDHRGKATRFTGASIDITDRKLMERALQESEDRFRRTFENAAVGMILTGLALLPRTRSAEPCEAFDRAA
jgi:PAS domain S-box-containing protein